MDAAISLRGVTKSFGSHTVLQDISFDIPRGKISAVMGPSGTGKSVLLKNVIGLLRPDAGEIWVDGEETVGMGEKDLYRVRRKFGVLFQDGALFSALTVAENIQVPYREHLHLSQQLMDELAAIKVAMVGLRDTAGALYPSELSGGMRKRAGLARALALDPEILFLDEPTAGLDPIGAAAFDELINDLKKTLGLTVFLVTHDLDSLHATCDRIAVLAEKHVILVGTIDDMLRSSHPWVHEYFHGPRARAALAGK